MRNCLLVLIVTAAMTLGLVPAASAEPDRDPTRPYSAQAIPSPGSRNTAFNVSAIFVSTARRVAIVNGQRVTEGDSINGAVVVEISKNALRLNLNGKELTTRLLPAGLRK